jgi:homoserine kinase
VRLTARVPATSANLGPGFDCFGLALDLCNEVTIDTDAEPGVSWAGEGAGELPTDGTDMVSAAMRHVESLVREARPVPLPSLHLHGANRIPLQRGLGSSSAAIVAGVALAHAVFDRANRSHDHGSDATFLIAAELEGHPDNAAAAVYGGFTIAMPNGPVHRQDPHPDLRPVVLVPERTRLATSEARSALSETVGREDAIFNAAHAALMVEALTRDPTLLWTALRDRLHQEARLALVPEIRGMFELLRADHVPVCISGAGPSLLAFEQDGHEVANPGEGWSLLRPGIRATGVEIVEG